MAPTRRRQLKAAAEHARKSRYNPRSHASPGSDPDEECTTWTGSVNHIVLDNTTDTGSDSADSESEDDIEELEGEELLCSLQKSAEKELEQMAFSHATKYHGTHQEVIEDAGHLCIFLPKFHCELNFIEFFWGVVKRYRRNHCNYTFDTLHANMPKALASVDTMLIRKWERRMGRWMKTI